MRSTNQRNTTKYCIIEPPALQRVIIHIGLTVIVLWRWLSVHACRCQIHFLVMHVHLASIDIHYPTHLNRLTNLEEISNWLLLLSSEAGLSRLDRSFHTLNVSGDRAPWGVRSMVLRPMVAPLLGRHIMSTSGRCLVWSVLRDRGAILCNIPNMKYNLNQCLNEGSINQGFLLTKTLPHLVKHEVQNIIFLSLEGTNTSFIIFTNCEIHRPLDWGCTYGCGAKYHN